MANPRPSITTNQELILFNQVNGICPLCPKSLVDKKNRNIVKVFEIAHIYPLNPTANELLLLAHEERLSTDVNDLDNLICMCPNCHEAFDKERTLEEYRLVVKIKKELIHEESARKLWTNTRIDEDIDELINALNHGVTSDEDKELKYDPKKIDDKVDSTISTTRRRTIHHHVQDYFATIRTKLTELEKLKPRSSESICAQIRSHYLLLAKSRIGISKKDIHIEMINWMKSQTGRGQDDAADIMVSYFIQNCDIFE